MVSIVSTEEVAECLTDRPATEDWEVNCSAVSQGMKPHFLLSVRHRREMNRSRVLLSTGDWERAAKVDAATRRLLNGMDSQSFGALVQLA